jgi:hypothetical protein
VTASAPPLYGGARPGRPPGIPSMRFTLTQPEEIELARRAGYLIHRAKTAPITFASKLHGDGKVSLKAWRGDRRKPDWFYLFRNQSQAAEQARKFLESVTASAAARAERMNEQRARRSALKASDHWSVGDVAYTSWGYDQTNVEYYQVTKVLPRSVIVRQVAVNSSDHGQPGGGKCAPRRFEFVGPEMLCPLSPSGGFSAGPIYPGKDKPSFRHSTYKWDGRARYTSSDR